MERTDLERTKKKFEVSYFVAKENMPISSYAKLLKLEEKHKVDVKGAYRNEKACGEFIECIGDDLKCQLNVDLAKAKFFSVLCDGSTDSAVIEEEVIYLLYFDPFQLSQNQEEKGQNTIGRLPPLLSQHCLKRR